MASPEIWLWIREDGQHPKVIAAGVVPPGPGHVLAVLRSAARGADAARELVGRWQALVARRGVPTAEDLADLEADPASSAEAVAVLRSVRRVADCELVREHGSAS